jgi:TPR repeat protein
LRRQAIAITNRTMNTGRLLVFAVLSPTAVATFACGPDEPAKRPETVATAPPPPVASEPPTPPPPPEACAPGTMREGLYGVCHPIVPCTNDEIDCDSKCEANDFASCKTLAQIAATKKEWQHAQTIGEKVCALGAAEGCEIAGTAAMLREDVQLEDRRMASFTSFDKGCTLGEAPLCERAASYFQSDPTKDTNRALSLLLRACAGNSPSCMTLSLFLLRVKQDGTMAVQAADKACNGTVKEKLRDTQAASCTQMGEFLEAGGSGLTKDSAKAVAFFERGCDKGDEQACVDLGFSLREGLGTQKDAAKARDVFAKGCKKNEQGKWQGKGCVWLGEAYEDGIGGGKDPTSAMELYADACAKDASTGGRACVRQAALLDRGAKDIAKNAAKANELYAKACETIVLSNDADIAAAHRACDRAFAAMERKERTKAADLWKERCEKRGDSHACVKWKALGGTPSDDVLRARFDAAQRACERGELQGCKDWQEMGGKPTREDLRSPSTPFALHPPGPNDPPPPSSDSPR